MSGIAGWLLCALLLAPSGALVDRIMAVIDEDTVTHSELIIEARVALVYREGADGADAVIDDPFLDAFLRDYLIYELLVAAQARRLATVDLSEEEIGRERTKFVQKLGSTQAYTEFLRRFGITDDRVVSILARHVRNDRYMARRIEGVASSSPSSFTSVPGTPSMAQDKALRTWLRELWVNSTIRLVGKSDELELCRAPGAC